MKTTRRGLFGVLAAAAAAVALAPVVKAEAANARHYGLPSYHREPAIILPPTVAEMVAEARAEDYERGRAVEAARQESRAYDEVNTRRIVGDPSVVTSITVTSGGSGYMRSPLEALMADLPEPSGPLPQWAWKD